MECDRETLTDLNGAIEQNPDDTRAIAQRGETYRQMEHFEAALADFDRAIELNPNYAWAIAHRGETYYQMKRYEEALDDFNRAIELNPDYIWAIAHRGVTYRFMGKRYYEKAMADFTQVIELKPDYAWAIAYRCLIYELMGRYQEGLVDFDTAIALDQTLFTPWRSKRGLMLSYDGRYTEAIEWCEQALKDNPDDYLALYGIAVAKARWQGLFEAQAEINRARSTLQAVVNSTGRGDAIYRLGGLAALESKADQALDSLKQAIPLEDEAIDLARHDHAWLELRTNSKFQALIAETIEV
jgi:tetratricopeptide (TPR) repeat protein